MFRRNKYDVMESETVKNTMNLVILVGKLSKDFLYYEKKKVMTKEFEDKFSDAVKKGVPYIRALANIGYENSIDLAGVDRYELFRYMNNNGINSNDFDINYNNAVNTYAKILFGIAIAEKENINITKVITPDTLLGLIKGDFTQLRDTLSESNVHFGSNISELVDKLSKDDFDISNITDDERSLLDEVHNDYMNREIYSKVNKSVITEDQIIKYAKTLGKKKSIF